MKIGLLGFGVVGRGVYEITENRDDMQVTKVLCLEDIKLPDAQAVHNIRDIVEDGSEDIQPQHIAEAIQYRAVNLGNR